jgi:hypothetical protein
MIGDTYKGREASITNSVLRTLECDSMKNLTVVDKELLGSAPSPSPTGIGSRPPSHSRLELIQAIE